MDNNTLLDFDYPTETASIIKVIGVGGGGGNAVQHMYRAGIHDVAFVLCNTDNQALLKSDIPIKIQLGKNTTKGLGAGNKPWVAKEAAEESADEVKALLDDGTEMVFITAGMGGGTGTGAAPVIAQIAKEKGILTVGIVTIPFVFEGERKILQALYGVEEMSKNVDALLVINNQRLFDIYQNLALSEAFKKADDTLTIAAKSIAETITIPGYINLDFADVETIMKDGGVAIMSSGTASGASRVSKAIENTLHSPLLNNNNIFNAKKILLNLSSSNKYSVGVEEMNEVHNFMAKFGKDIEVIWGAAYDDDLEENMKITILATGFGMESIPGIDESHRVKIQELSLQQQEKERKEAELIKKYYGAEQVKKMGKKTRPKPFIFTLEQLDNDSVIDAVINHPAYNRKPDFLKKEGPSLNKSTSGETAKNVIIFN
ncbi:MAG: cell division protein FtsZ [Candidatus Azobacteroides sp.]|nr:cell division protein FtsZ [Candidatus Azobacteroides sp.]